MGRFSVFLSLDLVVNIVITGLVVSLNIAVNNTLSQKIQHKKISHSVCHLLIIYKTLMKPVLMYGPETWVLSKLRFGVFERKILRRIYGPICEGTAWRSRYNEELYHLYDETDLVTTVRITRLR